MKKIDDSGAEWCNFYVSFGSITSVHTFQQQDIHPTMPRINTSADRDQPAIAAWQAEQQAADILQMASDHADEQRRGESLVAAFGAVERAMKPDGVKW